MPVAMLAVRVETHFPGLDVSRRICPTSRTRGLHPGFIAQEWPEEAKGGPGRLSRPQQSNSLTTRCKGKQMTTQTKSLYDRLGGLDAINAVTESWVARVGGDDRANGKFARTDIPRLKKEIVDQLCEATGGPCTYTGRSMRETHDGMKVTAGEFEVAMQHLGAALDALNVPKTEQDELVDLLRPMRDDIVEVDSPQTGTPLPDSYQAAPPLT